MSERPDIPELLSRADVRRIYFGGRGRGEVDRFFSVLEIIRLPGSGKQYVRRDVLEGYLDAHREAGVA